MLMEPNLADFRSSLLEAVDSLTRWQGSWRAFARHESLAVDPAVLEAAWSDYLARLKANPPFFHPDYMAQMLKPPHLVAVLGYLAAMTINPNNYESASGRPTVEMEEEVVRQIAAMFRLPPTALGHLTTSGTLANLEALWVSRELRPGAAIAYSEQSHYTHQRACSLLGVQGVKIPADAAGRMDLDCLERALTRQSIGTVVVTAGTSGTGAIDPIHEVVGLRERYGFRIHVDAAYGGFYALLAWSENSPIPAAPLRAIAECDSVAVDPHKHGLQPYGCGCVLFSDGTVRRLYRHAPPYVLLDPHAFNPGTVSLECSRAGAAAGALWLTLRCLPLQADQGLGPILRSCAQAAQRWARLLEQSEEFVLYLEPELDILTFFPHALSCSALDQASHRLVEALASEKDPLYLSLLQVDSRTLRPRFPDGVADVPSCRILRSVLMKPEHEGAVADFHQRVSECWRKICYPGARCGPHLLSLTEMGDTHFRHYAPLSRSGERGDRGEG